MPKTVHIDYPFKFSVVNNLVTLSRFKCDISGFQSFINDNLLL